MTILKIVGMLSLLLFLTEGLNAQIEDKNRHGQEEKKVYRAVEKMPEFPGGLDSLYNWLFKNIDYDQEGFHEGVNDILFAQFIVNEDGSVTEVEIVKGINYSVDRETKKILNLQPQWVPGEKDGKTVKVIYSLPVNFNVAKRVDRFSKSAFYLRSVQIVFDGGSTAVGLEYKSDGGVFPPMPVTCRTDTLNQKIDVLPEYPGGLDAFYLKLRRNFRYPEEAIQHQVEGKLLLDFWVDERGNISDMKICDSPSPLLDQEVKRVFAMLPAWKPGKYRGNAEPVNLTIPVNFILQ